MRYCTVSIVRGSPAEATGERLLPAPTGPRGAKMMAHLLPSPSKVGSCLWLGLWRGLAGVAEPLDRGLHPRGRERASR